MSTNRRPGAIQQALDYLFEQSMVCCWLSASSLIAVSTPKSWSALLHPLREIRCQRVNDLGVHERPLRQPTVRAFRMPSEGER